MYVKIRNRSFAKLALQTSRRNAGAYWPRTSSLYTTTGWAARTPSTVHLRGFGVEKSYLITRTARKNTRSAAVKRAHSFLTVNAASFGFLCGSELKAN